MDIEKFNGKTGKLVKQQNTLYHTFEPNLLPIKIHYDNQLIKILSEANRSVGELSGIAKHLRNPHLLIKPYIRKEAELSSKIEGTRTSLSEVFLHEKEINKRIDGDLREVVNYVKCLETGLSEIKEKLIDETLIKKLHKILMSGVRGESLDPGKYKILQNWIGPPYSDILEARFIPCAPESVQTLMKNLISYLNHSEEQDALIKAAVFHYQIETIHPFRDGNGRIGRLLIILYLCQIEILKLPLLYLSAFFERNKSKYEQTLLNVSQNGALEDWIKFFLEGVKKQAKEALEKASELEAYREECRQKLQKTSQSTNVFIVLDYLFENPFINIPDVAKILKVHYPTAENNVRILERNDIISEVRATRRGKMFYAPKIINILNK